jgi:hypothetical protein
MKRGESAKKSGKKTLSGSAKKNKSRPDILRSIKSTNKLSIHNSSSKSSYRGIVKLKDISLTPGLPKQPGRLHIQSAPKRKESDSLKEESTQLNQEEFKAPIGEYSDH